jgi:hypothetical protein
MFQVEVPGIPKGPDGLASDVAVSVFPTLEVARADDSLFPGFQRQLRLCNRQLPNGKSVFSFWLAIRD